MARVKLTPVGVWRAVFGRYSAIMQPYLLYFGDGGVIS